MPLKCSSPTGDEYAFLHDADSWEVLRNENQARKHLLMPCCRAEVTLKRSHAGTLFFAHKRVGRCTSKPESMQHLLTKDIIARAAVSIGWRANTEYAGPNSAWVADVVCTNPSSGRQIAFEVQWSRQIFDETAARQQRYAASGLRAFWFMRQADIPVSKGIPAARLVWVEEARALEVWLPSAKYISVWPSKKNEPCFWAQRVPLDSFVRGALTGALKFAPAANTAVPIMVCTEYSECRKCHKRTRLISHFRCAINQLFPGHGDFDFSLGQLDSLADSARWIRHHLGTYRLHNLSIGSINSRFSRRMGTTYLSNRCVHCDADLFLSPTMLADPRPFDLDAVITLTPDVYERLGMKATVERWWFSDRGSTP
jgi:hypothetical protein